jgi:hypothetical protein
MLKEMNRSFIQESRILETLRLEWWLAWRELPEDVRLHLKVPGFEIQNVHRYWGKWQGNRNKIAMRADLVMTAAWTCVREVLRHEMAHQLAEQVFHAEEAPHGPRFREACRLLRADPAASSDLPSIYERIHSEIHENKTAQTIRKLLALATSPHPREAESAMLKAHELMVKHNIRPHSGEDREYVSMCLGEPASRHSIDHDYLASILRDFYFVETVNLSIAMVSKVKRGKILEISGAIQNVRMAHYVFEFLRRTIADQVQLKAIGRKRSQKDYALGFLKGVHEKLEAQRKTLYGTIPDAMALVRAGDAGLRTYFRQRYPRLRMTRHWDTQSDAAAHSAGLADGRKVIIHRPIHFGSNKRALMIGYKENTHLHT